MKLSTITREQCQQAREWRNKELQFLRTPHLITENMQDDFFDNVINNRDSKHRYFAVVADVKHDIPSKEVNKYGDIETVMRGENVTEYNRFIGMGGLTNIEWENGTAEISLIIDPKYRGKGNGNKSVWLLLDEAFNNMGLHSVFGEVYDCGNRGFWEKLVDNPPSKICDIYTHKTDLIERKYYNGIHHGSMWFCFVRLIE